MLPLNAITIAAGTVSTGAPGATLPVGTFEGRIIRAGSTLAVRVGAVQLPLPEGAPFVTGQSVTVTRATQHGAVDVKPVTLPSPPTGSLASSALAETLGKVLEVLGVAGSRNPGSLTALLPPSVPLTEGQVRQILSLFVLRGALGADLEGMATHLQQAIAAGWNAPEWVRALLHLAGARPESQPDAIADWIKQAQRYVGRTAESSLGGAAPENVMEGLAAQVRVLKNDAGLRSALESINRWNTFLGHADATLERLDGRALHQLHALHGPYTFIELPAPFAHGFSTVQLHWFRQGDGTETGQDNVVLDVHVSQLGDLWVALQTSGGACRCVLRAMAPQAVAALRKESGVLEEALEGAGFGQVTVRVEPWDGDRVLAAARLLAATSGLDVNG